MHRIIIFLVLILLALPLTALAQPSSSAQLETAVNQERGARGVPTLAIHPALERAAATHNELQASAQTLCHDCLSDGSVSDQAISAGYQPAPLAWGQVLGLNASTAQEQMADWMASPGHRAAIVNPIYQHLGCNHLADSWAELWTCDLAAGGSLAPSASPAGDLEGLVNQARVANGVPALHIDSRLEASAQAGVDFMVSHNCVTPPCTGEPNRNQRATAAGYPTGGLIFELADARDTTPDQVVVRWSNPDDGTQFIMLYPTVTDLGCATGTWTIYTIFVCAFGQDRTSAATATPLPTAATAPTATSIPTSTLPPPTATTAPTVTLQPPTETTVPPTATRLPTQTMTPRPPTSVPSPTLTREPTATYVFPTATAVPTMTPKPLICRHKVAPDGTVRLKCRVGDFPF